MSTTPRGLTFVEMLVTLAIVIIITVTIVNSILAFYRANSSALEQEFQVNHARKGIDGMVKDFREATYGADGSYPIGVMGTSTILFYADVDNDTTIDRIRYTLSGTSLYRNVTAATGTPALYQGGGSTTTVSQYVRNNDEGTQLFRYYDSNNAEVTSSADIIRVVSITASLVVDITQHHTPGQFTLKGSATLRNLRAQ